MEECIYYRDGWAMSLYERLFKRIIATINDSLSRVSGGLTQHHKSISLLDIFGFEVFETNTFDQLSINYANEKLQEVFINNMVKTEELIYREDGIPFEEMKFEDNSEILTVIEMKPSGIIYCIFDEIILPESSEERLLNKLFTINKTSKILQRVVKSKTKFSLNHFNQIVEYEITGFIHKNQDPISKNLRAAMQDSKCTLLLKKDSVGLAFKESLTELLTKIKQTYQHFIICIKANHE
jgi:myosin heavy subunit